jgi:hypothetical protein
MATMIATMTAACSPLGGGGAVGLGATGGGGGQGKGDGGASGGGGDGIKPALIILAIFRTFLAMAVH